MQNFHPYVMVFMHEYPSTCCYISFFFFTVGTVDSISAILWLLVYAFRPTHKISTMRLKYIIIYELSLMIGGGRCEEEGDGKKWHKRNRERKREIEESICTQILKQRINIYALFFKPLIAKAGRKTEYYGNRAEGL